MDAIRLLGLRCEARLGVTPQERARPQPVALDVELRLPLHRAGQSDDLAHTIDYGAVAVALREAVEGREFHLLEALAESAAKAASSFGAESVTVRARKFDPPVKGGGLPVAEVEVTRP